MKILVKPILVRPVDLLEGLIVPTKGYSFVVLGRSGLFGLFVRGHKESGSGFGTGSDGKNSHGFDQGEKPLIGWGKNNSYAGAGK